MDAVEFAGFALKSFQFSEFAAVDFGFVIHLCLTLCIPGPVLAIWIENIFYRNCLI